MEFTVNEEQIKEIRDAIRVGHTDWLTNMIKNSMGIPADDNKNYFFYPRCYPYILLCALASELIENENEGTQVLKDLQRKCEDLIDIANLPTFEGRRILDLAEEKGNLAICDAIEALGGTKSPIELRTPESEKVVRETMSKLSTDHTLHLCVQDIIDTVKAGRLEFEDAENALTSLIGHYILENEQHEAIYITNSLFWTYELEENDPLIKDFHTLENLAAQRDMLELAADLRDRRADALMREVDYNEEQLAKWEEEAKQTRANSLSNMPRPEDAF